MSVPVILRRLAQAEFDDAADWYEGRRAGREQRLRPLSGKCYPR
jgi:hypothetical protein